MPSPYTTPLLLLPGLLCDAVLWRDQIDVLSDLIEPVVADLTRDDSIQGMAQRALDAAPPVFALAGLSMGGYVALEILRQAPDRVSRLALLDTTARADSAEQKRRRRGLIQLSKIGHFKGVTPRLLPLLVHPDRLTDVALTDAIMGMAERIGRDGFFNQQTAIMNRADSRLLLPAITCPTLVLCGRDDAITPLPLSEDMAACIPDARLMVLEACGHLSSMERPDEVSDALREWLQAGRI